MTAPLVRPDFVLLLDGDPEELAKRKAGAGARDNTAHEGLDEQRAIRLAYAGLTSTRLFKTAIVYEFDTVRHAREGVLEMALLGVEKARAAKTGRRP